MELLQLKYFCQAAKTENFSKTASVFSVPPSDISQCIKRLENELGASLFFRSANSIKLNETGKMFFEKINSAINLITEAENQIKDSINSGFIKISINTNRNTVMKAIEKYKKIYSDVCMEINHDIIENSDEYDVIIADEDFKNANFSKELIISEKFLLAVNKNNPLAKKENITGHDLKNVPFVCMNKGTSLFSVTQKIGNLMGFEPNIVINSDDPFYVRKCVEFGLGVTFMPEKSWNGLFGDNVVFKKISNYTRNTYAYTNKEKYMKKCTKEFLEILKKELQ